MRFLWIEDFDGGKTGKTETKNRLEMNFQLCGRNINIDTLEGALKFLEESSNWNLFDAVLIDIRFRVCMDCGESEFNEEEIYKKYFESFLTREKYLEYTKRVNDDINSASSGILLYLALVHRYNYSQDRIAFVTANVDETSEKLSDLIAIKEIVCKVSQYGITEADKDAFSLCNESLLKMFAKLYKVDIEVAEKMFDIPETDDIEWDNLQPLLENIDNVETKLKNKLLEKKSSEVGLKYNSVKEQFEKVGLIVPVAFEKPVGEYADKISWRFEEWVNSSLSASYYRLRARLIPICEEILLLHLGDERIHNMIRDTIELFPANRWANDDSFLYARIIREVLQICDNLNDQGCDGVTKNRVRILRIARNWSAHQGIKDISAPSIVFIFVLVLKQFVEIERLPKLQLLVRNLIGDYLTNENRKVIEDSKEIQKIQDEYKEMHRAAFFGKNRGEKKKGYYYKDNADLSEFISAIGNEHSPIRNTASMEHLYTLFLSQSCAEVDNDEYIFRQLVWNELRLLRYSCKERCADE